jgi:hypothetical protein
MADSKQVVCQCNLILLTADEMYNHLQSTGHRIRDTIYQVENYHLIEQQLAKWRMELFAAVHTLQGDHLEQLKTLIADVANSIHLEISDTGTFIKADD